MRILYVTTISKTTTFFINHIKYLYDKGHTVEIACNMSQPLPNEINQYIEKTHNINFQRNPLSLDNFISYQQIKKVIKDGEYDIVHTHTPVASFITRLSSIMQSTKVIYTAHGFHFYKGAPLKNWTLYYPFEKIAAKWTDGIITINQADYLLSLKKIYKNKPQSVYHIDGVGIESIKFQQTKLSENEKETLYKDLGISKQDFVLTCIGELNTNKNQIFLINAFNKLKEDIPNIKLLIVGEGPLKEYYEKSTKFQKNNLDILFVGYRNDIQKILKMTDIVVSSSKREGLPVNIIEAMATGVPCVVTDIRGNSDLIKDSVNGFLYSLDDETQYINSIKKLYEDTKIRKIISENNIKHSKKYDVSEIVKQLDDVYENLVNS